MTENNQAMAHEETHSAPVLTLNGEGAAKMQLEKAVDMLEENAKEAPQAPDAREIVQDLASGLTEEELKAVQEFAGQIDLGNPDHVMLYGADAQKKISTFADSILNNVKTDDTGDVGEALTSLIGELKGFEASTEKPKGLKGLFHNAKRQITTIQAKYEDVSANVEKIAASLEDHQVQLLKDVAMFNRLYDVNMTYFKELTMYIVAGE